MRRTRLGLLLLLVVWLVPAFAVAQWSTGGWSGVHLLPGPVTLDTGPFRLPAGSASAPPLTFTADPAQGLFLDTTNDLIGTTGLSVLGRILQTALATPGSITVTNIGTAGATTYTYKLVALSGTGVTPAGAASSTATGNATLSSTNLNRLAWSQVAGATGYRIYRTVGGATQGLIATIAAGATLTVDDTGLAGGGETAPSADTTGQVLLPDGTAAAPSLSFTSATNTGLMFTSAAIDVVNAGTAYVRILGNAVRLRVGTPLGWSSGVVGSASDLELARSAPGSLTLGGIGNGQLMGLKQLTELTTIAAAATTDTAIQIPANAVVFAVSVRVTTVIPTATTFTVTGTTSGTAFQTGASVSTAATTTDVGTKSCPYLNATAQTIRITPNLPPLDTTGRVRVTIHYYDITAPTS